MTLTGLTVFTFLTTFTAEGLLAVFLLALLEPVKIRPAGKARAAKANRIADAVALRGAKRVRLSKWTVIACFTLRVMWLLFSANSSGARAPNKSSNNRVQTRARQHQERTPALGNSAGHQTSTRPAESPPAISFESKCSNGL